jgi:hypothetical protein
MDRQLDDPLEELVEVELGVGAQQGRELARLVAQCLPGEVFG